MMNFGGKPLIVIEHLEDHLSHWIVLEYKHVKSMVGDRLVITNARLGGGCKRFKNAIGDVKCYNEPLSMLKGELYSREDEILILDPKAEKLLEPSETAMYKIVVVGGILGDHPPRGRTSQFLSSRFPRASKRSLGPHQLSIDGAVYVYLQVERGINPLDVPLVVKPKIKFTIMDFEYEIELPFAYPKVDNKPLFAPGLLELLKTGLAYEEHKLMQKLDST
ncbi:MAG TPA: hypothetical protein EYH26_01565 [Pyrodictium sp.]|nr:hypothetical protein [Pyrodictium sp.]